MKVKKEKKEKHILVENAIYPLSRLQGNCLSQKLSFTETQDLKGTNQEKNCCEFVQLVLELVNYFS